MTQKKVGVVGFKFSELRGEDPLNSLMGILPRNWAIYDGLKKYGLDTSLYLDPHIPVDECLLQKPQNFVRSPKAFIDKIENEFDYTVLCGTRMQTLLEHHPWLAEVKKGRFIWAMCYENHPGDVPPVLVDNMVAAGFTSPRYSREFARKYSGVYTRLLTTGQPNHVHAPGEPAGDIVYVGHIHNVSNLALFAKIAEANKDRELHIISSRVRAPNSGQGEYLQFARMEDDSQRAAVFYKLVEDITGEPPPSNLRYHFLPHGEEYGVLERASVGLSICHNKHWKIDNSKVTYYLNFGIPVISQLPSLSFRFCQSFDAGEAIRFGASVDEWNEAINRWADWSFEKKIALRERAAQFFSWKNVAFEVYDMILEDMYPLHVAT